MWERGGRPNPPPHPIKQRVLRDFAQNYGLRVFVETGTYYGDMVAAMRPQFVRLYSIELSADLHAKTVRRFKGCTNVELIQGDSGVELGKLLPRLTEPTLFWLDGHYSAGETAKGSKDTPILEELRHILCSENQGHVIVIDDARLFGADAGYPTISELTAFVKSLRPDVDVAVACDAIRITPGKKQFETSRRR